MPFRLSRQSIKDLRLIEKAAGKAAEKTTRALVRAVNLGARKGRTIASKQIRSEIAFKAPYVNSRLKVTKKASPQAISATISGRDRPTQLIRFATPASINKMRNKKGKTRRQINRMRASVRVKKGGPLRKLNYFWVSLRNNNEGLAFRVPGTTSAGKSKFQVVYSVSVDQAFGDVRERVEPQIDPIVEKEFDRQLGVLFNAR